MPPHPRHVGELLETWSRQRPNAEAVRYGDRCWTWSQWADRIRRVGGRLAESVGPGERVAFLDKNNAASLEVTIAAALVGAVSVPVNFRLSADEIGYILGDSKARVLFAGHELSGLVAGAGVDPAVTVGGPEDEYEAWAAEGGPAPPEHPIDPEDCFLQLYTSGTTGSPKGAMLSHRAVLAHARAMGEMFGVTGDSVAQAAMPLFHVGGTCWSFVALNAGARVVVTREVVPQLIGAEIAEQRVTHTFFVPAVLDLLMSTPEFTSADLSSLIGIAYGASPIPPPLLRRCRVGLDAELVGMYGMTETSGVVTALPGPAHVGERFGSVGLPLPGVEVTVVEPDSRAQVRPGETGEVRIRGRQLFSGYWGRPEDTATAMDADGWYRTGDGGHLDDEGYLFLTDRIADLVISGGENVYPAQVEAVLAEHPGVAEVAVIGVPDERWGESVRAVVVAAATKVTEEALIAFARERLAGYKCPRSVVFVAALPRNAAGKVLKRELRR